MCVCVIRKTVGQHFIWYRASRGSLGDSWASRWASGQTDRHTDVLIAMLRTPKLMWRVHVVLQRRTRQLHGARSISCRRSQGWLTAVEPKSRRWQTHAFIQKFTCRGGGESWKQESHTPSDYEASISPKVESHTKSILYHGCPVVLILAV